MKEGKIYSLLDLIIGTIKLGKKFVRWFEGGSGQEKPIVLVKENESIFKQNEKKRTLQKAESDAAPETERVRFDPYLPVSRLLEEYTFSDLQGTDNEYYRGRLKEAFNELNIRYLGQLVTMDLADFVKYGSGKMSSPIWDRLRHLSKRQEFNCFLGGAFKRAGQADLGFKEGQFPVDEEKAKKAMEKTYGAPGKVLHLKIA